ncbi:MAG: hypothetical protein QGD94_11925, partial [Planctomycetia bacterium]|nr:hypothetical protein [Planctomycetia bacterium]
MVKYSKVEFQFRTTTAVEAWMVEGGKKLALTRKAKSSEFFSSLLEPLSQVEYAIGLRDKYNLINRGSDSIIVRVVEDSMPVIRIERPLGNLILLPHESVTVACLASDNFGVRGISLTLHKIAKDKTEKPRRVEVVKGSPTRESLTGEYVLKMSELGVQPGEQLEYTAETADFAGIPALRLSTSETFRIAVLGEQEYLRMRLLELKRLALDVRRLAEAEHREAKSTGVLATQDTKALESTETTREAKAGAERQVQIATRTENVAKQVERVVGELARAPSVSKDLLSDVERVARALRSVESTQMAKATKGLRKAAADDKAEQRKPELEGAEREQKDAAVRLDNLANALDKLGDLGIIKNLAKTAAHIAKVQRDLAKATGEKAPETAGMTPQELPENLKSDIEDLAQGEQDIKSEIGKLEENLRQGAAALAFGAPAAAQAAMSAAQSIASQ